MYEHLRLEHVGSTAYSCLEYDLAENIGGPNVQTATLCMFKASLKKPLKYDREIDFTPRPLSVSLSSLLEQLPLFSSLSEAGRLARSQRNGGDVVFGDRSGRMAARIVLYERLCAIICLPH